MSSASVATTLLSVAGKVMAAMAGGFAVDHQYKTVYLDHFAVDSADLTDAHRAAMDHWIAGDKGTAFPFQPGNPNHRIVLVAGLASQTGPEAHNLELGEERARAIYDYLAAGIDADQLDENVQSVGSSRPRVDAEGSEVGENRAVGVVLEIRTPLVAAEPPPPPQEDPPPPKSQSWELALTGVVGFGDPIPIADALGGQYLTGTLRNLRTGESREFRIVAAGMNAGISAAPVDIGINLQGDVFTPFATHWADFDDFDYSMVTLVGVGLTDVYDWSAGAIGFNALYTSVEPAGLVLRTNVGVGAQLQYGVFVVDDAD